MDTLYLELKEAGTNKIELRYRTLESLEYVSTARDGMTIESMVRDADASYDTSHPEPPERIGKRLYQWLNGQERLLERVISEFRSDRIVIAIDISRRLASLPWETLHDGSRFLVERRHPEILTIRWKKGHGPNPERENRPLRVLFMATAPTDVNPVLDHDLEEALIISKTERQKLTLVVEESGNLEQLGYLASGYGHDGFDVIHLSGHAALSGGEPFFYTENEFGEAVRAKARDIHDALPHGPKLIFLSGCWTGATADLGAASSLAERIIDLGAKAALAWGRRVRDEVAANAAAEIYRRLADGDDLPTAILHAYRYLISEKEPSWHTLRAFVYGDIPPPYVTPSKWPNRKDPLFLKASAPAYLGGKSSGGKVADAKSFVGRRREIQRCLRAMSSLSEHTGVLIWGMGGLGKSSLANRVLLRLSPDVKRVIISDRSNNRIDMQRVVNGIADSIPDSMRNRLLAPVADRIGHNKLGLGVGEYERRLRDVLHELEPPHVFVIDDFEGNFETQDANVIRLDENGLPTAAPDAADAMLGLLKAIQGTDHKLIVTSRYNVPSSLTEGLDAFQLAQLEPQDILKKAKRLEAEHPVAPEVREEYIRRSEGNPRLMEWLYQTGANAASPADAVRQEIDRFRGDIHAEDILSQMSPETREVINRLGVFKIPATAAIVARMFPEGDPEEQIRAAIKLGFVDQIEDELSHEKLYIVSQIVVDSLRITPSQETLSLAAKAACREWCEPLSQSKDPSPKAEPRVREAYRLAELTQQVDALAMSARILGRIWLQTGKEYSQIIRICGRAFESTTDSHLYITLAEALFESGQRLPLTEEDQLDGFQVLERGLETVAQDDQASRCELLEACAMWQSDYGNQLKAKELAIEAYRLCEGSTDPMLKLSTLCELGRIHCDLRDFARGEMYYREAVKLSSGLLSPDDVTRTVISTNMEIALYARNGNDRTVSNLLEESIKLFDNSTSRLNYARTLAWLAQVKLDARSFRLAHDLCLNAINIFRELGSKRGEATALILMARIEMMIDQGKAADWLERAINIGDELRHSGILVNARLYEAELRNALKNPDLAMKALDDAVREAERAGNLYAQVWAASYRCRIALDNELRNVGEAIAVCERMLDRFSTAETPAWAVMLYNGIGDAYTEIGDSEKARESYTKALHLRTAELSPDIAYTQFQLAEFYARQGRDEEATEHYNRAYQIDREAGNIANCIRDLDAMATMADRGSAHEVALRLANVVIGLRRDMSAKGKEYAASLSRKFLMEAKLGRYGSDLKELEEAEQITLALPSDYDKAVYLDVLAIQRYGLSGYARALEFWRESSEIVATEASAVHLLAAFAETKLGYTMLAVNEDHQAAVQRLRASRAVLRTRLGDNHELVEGLTACILQHGAASPVLNIWCMKPYDALANEPDRSADVLQLLVGADIISFFDPDQGSKILDRIPGVRRDLLASEEFLLPNVRIMDSVDLDGRTYTIRLLSDRSLGTYQTIFEAKIPTNYAVPASQPTNLSALYTWKVTTEPAYDHPIQWVNEDYNLPKNVDAILIEDIIARNLEVVVRKHKEEIIASISR